LDYPACTFLVTKVNPILDQPKLAHEFLNELDWKVYELCKSDCLGGFTTLSYLPRTDDSPDTFKNVPLRLQLVGRSQGEEAVIAMTEIVHAALNTHKVNFMIDRGCRRKDMKIMVANMKKQYVMEMPLL
jgi:amidase